MGMRGRLNLCLLVVTLLGALWWKNSQAAEVTIQCLTGNVGCEYQIKGTIVLGDYERLRRLLMQKSYGINYVMLDSPGGDIDEALRIAGLVRDAYLNTGVWADYGPNPLHDSSGFRRGTCASACFLIWLAGSYRNDSESPNTNMSAFFLHRPYFSADRYRSANAKELADATQMLTARTRDYLTKHSVPQRIIDEMMKRSSIEAYQLTQSDAWELSGDADWYQEWEIARCGAGPRRDRVNPWKLNAKEYKAYMANVDRIIDDMNKNPDKWLPRSDCVTRNITNARREFLDSLGP